MPIIFSLVGIKVNSFTNSSFFNVGQNIIIGVNTTSKNVQGSGQTFGDFAGQPSLVSNSNDPDVTDYPNMPIINSIP